MTNGLLGAALGISTCITTLSMIVIRMSPVYYMNQIITGYTDCKYIDICIIDNIYHHRVFVLILNRISSSKETFEQYIHVAAFSLSIKFKGVSEKKKKQFFAQVTLRFT